MNFPLNLDTYKITYQHFFPICKLGIYSFNASVVSSCYCVVRALIKCRIGYKCPDTLVPACKKTNSEDTFQLFRCISHEPPQGGSATDINPQKLSMALLSSLIWINIHILPYYNI